MSVSPQGEPNLLEQQNSISGMASTLHHVERALDNLTNIVNAVRDTQLENKPYMDLLIGPPNLEEKIKNYFEERLIHKVNNIRQEIVLRESNSSLTLDNTRLKLESSIQNNVLGLAQSRIDLLEESRRTDTVEKDIGDLKKYLYMGLGALAALEFLLKFIKF